MSSELKDQQIRCVFLPPNTTSLIQPMDQGMLQTIKMLYRCDLLMKAVGREEEEDNVSFIWLAKSLNIKDCLFMVSSTWEMHLAKLQTYGIFRVTDRVRSRHIRITDIPLYSTACTHNMLQST